MRKYALLINAVVTMLFLSACNSGSSGNNIGSENSNVMIAGSTSSMAKGSISSFKGGFPVTFLNAFESATEGADPYANVILGNDGNLYGTTYKGGMYNKGTVFMVESSTEEETVIYSFGARKNDGANPLAGLTQDSHGNLYGTTHSGGAKNYGTVFMIYSSGGEAVLHSFESGADGANPYAGLVQDRGGNLYGTTYAGGVNNSGTIFKVANGHETVLYSFAGGTDGSNPMADLIRGSDSFYGTTCYGGTNNRGTVFKISFSGSSESVVYSFESGADGEYPTASLIRDNAGNLYGTTVRGGANNYGTIFEVTSTGEESVIYSFAGGTDGANPYASLIKGKNNNFYGTTESGGANNYGTIFEVTSSGEENIVYSFESGVYGAKPSSRLTRGVNGSLYGTTRFGGSGNGSIFKIVSGEIVVYSFANGNDGANPVASLIEDSNNNFYGTTKNGGVNGNGIVFKISNGQESVLYPFRGWGGAKTFQSNIRQRWLFLWNDRIW